MRPSWMPCSWSAQNDEQRAGIEQRGDRRAERQPAEPDHAHQHDVQPALTSTVMTLTITGVRLRPSA